MDKDQMLQDFIDDVKDFSLYHKEGSEDWGGLHYLNLGI